MKRKKHKRAGGVPTLDPQQQAMLEEANEAAQAMLCPVALIKALGERTQSIAAAAEASGRLADLAVKLHPTAAPAFAPLLGDLSALLARHRDELMALIPRLEPLTDHDATHDHLEPDEGLFMQVVTALFGEQEGTDAPDAAEVADEG